MCPNNYPQKKAEEMERGKGEHELAGGRGKGSEHSGLGDERSLKIEAVDFLNVKAILHVVEKFAKHF